MQGSSDTLAIADLRSFGVKDAGAQAMMGGMMGNRNAGAAAGFEALYDEAVGDVLHGAGKESFEAMKMIQNLKPGSYIPARGAQYPRGRFGESLLQIAQLIKAGVGLEVAFADMGGWDTHVNEGGARGQLAVLLGQFGAGLNALVTDLGPARMDDVVILTMSEFGRTARENGTRGTDHGHANAMFVIGGAARGGKVYGEWPGLRSDNLYEGRDLALTTDFRDVFGEAAMKHLGNTNLQAVFPGYAANAAKFRNVLG